jgi:Domain of unknown function (DUF4349)
MSQSDLIAPDRLDSLLAGDPPESVREAVVQGLVRELRASAPPAPASLRERVLVERLPVPRRVPRGRLVAVLVAAALLAGFVALVAVYPQQEPRSAAGGSNLLIGATNASGSAEGTATSGSAAQEMPSSDSSGGSSLKSADAQTEALDQPAPFTGAFDMGRARDVKMTMELRLKNADDLSEAAQEAMRTTAKLGGVVAASKVDTSGARGTATLQLQIPVGKLDQAVAELSQLGTITKQNVTAVDLQGSVDETTKVIRHLQAAIAADKLRLESGTLTDQQRLDTQLRLIRERQRLDQIRRDRSGYLAEAATAEITLGLHTGKGATVGATHGQFRRTLDAGLTALSKVAAVAILVLLFLAPLILVGALIWLAGRSRRRRIEAEILNRPRPAAPSSPPSA